MIEQQTGQIISQLLEKIEGIEIQATELGGGTCDLDSLFRETNMMRTMLIALDVNGLQKYLGVTILGMLALSINKPSLAKNMFIAFNNTMTKAMLKDVIDSY